MEGRAGPGRIPSGKQYLGVSGENISSLARTQWPVIVAGALVAGALFAGLGFYLVATRDLAPPAAPPPATFLAPPPAAVGKLSALADQVRRITRETSRALPAQYDKGGQGVDALLDSPMTQLLPATIEGITEGSSSPSQTKALADLEESKNAWTLAHRSVQILSLQMQRQLVRADDGAWKTTQIALRFSRWLLDQSHTFDQLTMAQSGYMIVLRTLLQGIDVGQPSVTQLRELASLPEPTGLDQKLLEGLRAEYALFETELARVRSEKSGPLDRITFHPNRTARAWLDAMSGSTRALGEGSISGAYDALATELGVLERQGHGLRNSVGDRLLATTLPGDLAPMAQSVDLIAAIRLIRARAGIALHRIEQGKLPEALAQMAGRELPSVPVDPWDRAGAGIRFLPSERRIYSLGRNRVDDHGHFSRNLFADNGTADLGCEFSN